MTVEDFDRWRERYPYMSDLEHKEFAQRGFEEYPEQAHGKQGMIEPFVRGKVLEIGGWRGDHAGYILANRPDLVSWTNIEFCDRAAKSMRCHDPRYRVQVPVKFRWWADWDPVEADCLVMSHFIEHISGGDLIGLMHIIKQVPRVYVEAPLNPGGQDWKGYLGTHALPWGWSQVETLFEDHGYRVAEAHQDIRIFEKVPDNAEATTTAAS